MKACKIFLLFLFLLPATLHAQLWKMYADTAKQLRSEKKFEQAITYFIRAKNLLAKDSAATDTYLQTYNSIGDTYFSINNFDSAKIIYLAVKDITEKLRGQNADLALIYDKLGNLYANTSQYKNAEQSFLQAKNIKEKLFTNQSTEYALSCTFLGNVYTAIQQYDKATALYEEGLGIRMRLLPKDSAGYAQLCNNLSNLYRELGKYEAAEPLALEAKKIRGILFSGKDSLRMLSAYAISCTNLGNLYRDIGQYENAAALYIEAKDLRQKIAPYKQTPVYAASCNVLAGLYYFMNRYDDAEKLYIEAKDIREKIFTKESAEYAESCSNLSNLYTERGDYKKALDYALQAKKILTNTEDTNAIAVNLEDIGLLYLQTKQFTKAITYLSQSATLWKRVMGENHPSYQLCISNLAKAYWNAKDTANANKFYALAFDIQNKQIKNIFQFTSEQEKSAYLENIGGSVDEYYSYYLKTEPKENASQPYKIALLSSNLTLSAAQNLKQQIYNSEDSSLITEYNNWLALKKQTGTLYLAKNSDDNEILKTIEQQANTLEKDLVSKSSTFENAIHSTISWQAIKDSLKENEAAVEFESFNYFNGLKNTDSVYYIALLIIKNKPQPVLIKLFEQKQLDALLATNTTEIYAGNGLYNLTWKPIEKYLSGISKIYYSPSGDLHNISFAAIQLNDASLLSEKFNLVQLNTTAAIINLKEIFLNTTATIQLYGGIDYKADSTSLKSETIANTKNDFVKTSLTRGASLQYLPATKTEVESIQTLARENNFIVTTLKGADATEESFKALNAKFSPSVLHIATHGFYFPDPLKTDSIQRKFGTTAKAFRESSNPMFRTGLLFAGANNIWQGKSTNSNEDGVVTAYDVSNMYLPNTKLVVLSACETALGDIQGSEGVFGLQRAFKMAGVQNLIMSLWKVPDRESAEFMQFFYANIFQKKSIANAFTNAQTAMRNKYKTEPLKWAAWILVQ